MARLTFNYRQGTITVKDQRVSGNPEVVKLLYSGSIFATIELAPGDEAVVNAPQINGFIAPGGYEVRYPAADYEVSFMYVRPDGVITHSVNGYDSVVVVNDSTAYLGGIAYTLKVIAPNWTIHEVSSPSITISPAYSGKYEVETTCEINYNAGEYDVVDLIEYRIEFRAYKIDVDELFGQVRSLLSEYDRLLSVGSLKAIEFRKKVHLLNIYQDEYERAVAKEDKVSAYKYLCEIYITLNGVEQGVYEIPVVPIGSVSHVHENKSVLDALSEVSGRLYYLGIPVGDDAATILTKIKTVDGIGSGLDAEYLGGVRYDGYSLSTHAHSFSSITSKPTTLSGYGITDAQPLDEDLTAIAGLTGTTGILKKIAANTWTLDTNTYALQSHIHSISDVTNLQSTLDGKAGLSTANTFTSTNRFDGNIAVKTSVDSYVALKINQSGLGYGIYISDTSAENVAQLGIYEFIKTKKTSNVTHHDIGVIANLYPLISSGVTNSGSARGVRAEVLRNYDSSFVDSGTLGALYGIISTYGHNDTNASASPITNNVYGLMLQPYRKSGSITNLYDIYIAGDTGTGTVTNRYGIYQASTGTNYLSGLLQLNNNLEVKASGTSSSAAYIPVFTADPTSTIRRIYTRTPGQLKSDIGIGNVTNDAQLKRSGNDFASFSEKFGVSDNDILLIEDSAASYAKKKITVASLLSEYSVPLHGHVISDVSGLQTALNGKANVAHAHAIVDIEDLQSSLDGKAGISHTHTPSQVGLGNVTNDAQLKRAGNDFTAFSQKTGLSSNDILLIEDSAASYAKKKVTYSGLLTTMETYFDGKYQGSANLFVFPHGLGSARYVLYAVGATALTTIALTASRVYYFPFVPIKAMNITEFGVNVTAAASGTINVGVYDSNANYRPKDKIYEIANYFDSGTTGYKSQSANLSLNANTLYWLAIIGSAAATVRGVAVAGLYTNLGISASSTSFYTFMYESGSGYALPNSASATPTMGTGTVPAIFTNLTFV